MERIKDFRSRLGLKQRSWHSINCQPSPVAAKANDMGSTDKPTLEELLSPEAVATCIAPYVMEYADTHSEGWRKIVEKAERKVQKASARTQSLVKATYEEIWSEVADSGLPPKAKPVAALWGEKALIIDVRGIRRAYLLYLARIIEQLAPHSVLEVGFGSGANLVVLANLFPGVRFAGVELTEAGLKRCQHLCSHPVPPELRALSPLPLRDSNAHLSLEIRQASADALPYADNSFDLVFTVLALEQMEEIRDTVLREIARVAANHVAMIEPFHDWNCSGIRKQHVETHGYFSASVGSLRGYKLTPICVTNDFPAKLHLGVGLVLSSKG